MEEQNKYYTPLITEFRVGFEYEYTYDGISDWTKGPNLDKDIPYNSIYQKRVKYLDRKDIEELGFIYDNNTEPIPSRRDWEVPKLDKYELPLAFFKDTQLEDGKLYIIYLYSDNTIWIEYIKDCCGMDYIFKGIIKNKSELKVLLLQLGITTL